MTPLLPRPSALWHRLAIAGITGVVRASLVFSPVPTALIIRKLFAVDGQRTAQRLARHAPPGVAVVHDEHYGDGPDELYDLYRPAGARGALPCVVWVPGGGWVGGAKEFAAGYYQRVAAQGYAVAVPRYSLAPRTRYPTPVRQIMAALQHLGKHAEQLGVDVGRVVLAGDSAGAQIAAQVGAITTTAGYAEAVGISPTLAPEQLRGAVLACGPYDLALFGAAGGAGHRIATAMLWAYAGTRRFTTDPTFAGFSVARHVTSAFPPTLLTVGNADPLVPHSELLAERLRALDVPVDTVFFPAEHQPPLGHEYQFDLDTDAGRRFLARLCEFLEQHLR